MDRSRVEQVVAAIWQIESGAITASLTRRTGDLGLAEDLAQDAFTAALTQWPSDGLPANPAAWLMTVANRRLADHARQRATLDRKLDVLATDARLAATEDEPADPRAYPFDQDPLDQLRLIFMCCHPGLSPPSRIALTLKVVAGLQVPEIARLLLASDTATAQRLVRAKRTLRDQSVRFELPPAERLGERLGTVLGVVYGIFTEGHASTSGQEGIRPGLCHDAVRLARRLTHLAPEVAEVHGLCALLEYQSSRLTTRTTPDGQLIALDDQDRRRWDATLIARGNRALDTARHLGGGQYTLQAEIAASHVTTIESTDWTHIVALYDRLLEINPSPVVALNRAIATGRANGPAASLPLLDALPDDPRMSRYPYLHAAIGDAHERLHQHDRARASYLRAESLADTPAAARQFRVLADRVRPHADGSGPPSPAA